LIDVRAGLDRSGLAMICFLSTSATGCDEIRLDHGATAKAKAGLRRS
jgi:hypothetical protein